MTNAGNLPPMHTPPLSVRKRKRAAHQFTVNYSEVQEIDSAGKVREVIVIEDTPPPSTISPATTHTQLCSASYQPPFYAAPVRTRARAAAEAHGLSASSSSVIAHPPKKRKRDPADDAGTVSKKTIAHDISQNGIVANKSWASGSGTLADDVGVSHIWYAHGTDRFQWSHQAAKGQVPCDDKEGHYIIVPDDMINNRCKLFLFLATKSTLNVVFEDRTVRLLGQGTFGKVVEAIDTETDRRVAIKIIRAIPKYRDASKIEIRVLQKLKERDPMNRQ